MTFLVSSAEMVSLCFSWLLFPGREAGIAGSWFLHHSVQAPGSFAHGPWKEQLQEVCSPQPVCDPQEPLHQHHAGKGAARGALQKRWRSQIIKERSCLIWSAAISSENFHGLGLRYENTWANSWYWTNTSNCSKGIKRVDIPLVYLHFRNWENPL